MYLMAGCFVDSLAMVTLTVHTLYPTVRALGFDPIWFGVIIAPVVEAGVSTPPMGTDVQIIRGVAPCVR
jgi:C4-dicarboxylate transporter DctM subunit